MYEPSVTSARYIFVILSRNTHVPSNIPSREKNISTLLLAHAALPPTNSGKRIYVPAMMLRVLLALIHVILYVGDQVGLRLGRGVGEGVGSRVGEEVVVGLSVGLGVGSVEGIVLGEGLGIEEGLAD